MITSLYLKATYRKTISRYVIYVYLGDVCCTCSHVSQPRIASDAFEHCDTVDHCCVPTAYYRMARTIRFHLRSPRYFRRASPIPLQSIRHSIGRNDGKSTHACYTVVPDATMSTGKFKYVGLLYILRSLTHIECLYTNSSFPVSNFLSKLLIRTSQLSTSNYLMKIY